MTSPLERIDEIVPPGCLAESCCKQGCVVELDGAPGSFRLIDMDHPDAPTGRGARRMGAGQRGSRRCDFLFIGENDGTVSLYVAPLDLKSSGVRAGKVQSQLQAGARIAEHVVPGVSSIRFVPVAAHGGKLHRKQINDLAKSENKVLFRKMRHPIRLIRCGDPLVAVLR